MDVRGKRWPTKRCAGPAQAQDNTIINRIMLRFRPIAPKPVTDGSVPGENKVELVTKTRAKRKYVRVKKNKKCKINNKEEEEEEAKKRDLNVEEEGMKVVYPGIRRTWSSSSETPMSSSVQEKQSSSRVDDEADRSSAVVVGSNKRVVESWLVVEGGISETWVDVRILGSTDRERMRNLEVDTCPGLISDSLHRVQWVNLAYKKMVNGEGEEDGSSSTTNDTINNKNNNNNTGDEGCGGGGGGGEVVVWLVVKEKIPVVWPVFACRVRVIYTRWRKEKQYSQTMPCDVWKMDFGGYAWRLDAKAALSLGR